jgi:hypothetical protein
VAAEELACAEAAEEVDWPEARVHTTSDNEKMHVLIAKVELVSLLAITGILTFWSSCKRRHP